MQVVHHIRDLRETVATFRQAGESVGLVPTMGALHAGHLSLVDASRRLCDRTVVTVFVNPTQFGPGEDFQRYPRDLEADAQMLAKRGCDLVFAPDVSVIYPEGCDTTVEVASVAKTLEGKIRPTHFSGVATVVLKLFNLVQADTAFFGQKDYQQTVVVRQMVRDLNVPTAIEVCPIVRESDGLAMSSRNAYLSAEERAQAASLSAGLLAAKAQADAGEHSTQVLCQTVRQSLKEAGLEPQYVVALADGTMDAVDQIEGPIVLAVAALVGKTRLIDNVRIG